jgi:hypothetical protein
MIIVRDRNRVVLGALILALACGLLGYGYVAPPRLACDEHLVYQAVADRTYATLPFPKQMWASVMIDFVRPVYPFPRQITAVSVPDSELTVELLRVSPPLGPAEWWLRQSVWLRINVPDYGQYIVTELDFHFAGGASQRCNIGRVVLDARPALAYQLLPTFSDLGQPFEHNRRYETHKLSEYAAGNRAESPLSIVAVDAGEFGRSEPNVRLAPGEETALDLTLLLPPRTGRTRHVRIEPWLSIELDGKQGWASGMVYNWDSRMPPDPE